MSRNNSFIQKMYNTTTFFNYNLNLMILYRIGRKFLSDISDIVLYKPSPHFVYMLSKADPQQSGLPKQLEVVSLNTDLPTDLVDLLDLHPHFLNCSNCSHHSK